jgi:hypothetical protein
VDEHSHDHDQLQSLDRSQAERRRLLELDETTPDRAKFRASLTPEQRAELSEAYHERQHEIARGWDEWERGQQSPAQANQQRDGRLHQHRAEPTPKSKKHSPERPKKNAAGFSQGRINQRRADLWAAHRHDFKKLKKKVTAASYDAYVSKIVAAFARRDLFDPDSVTSAELGAHLKITLAVRIQIEKEETDFRIDKGWTKPGANPYRLKTIAPCDKGPDEVDGHYRQVRSEAQAARRKKARAELRRQQAKETEMTQTHTHTTQESTITTYTDLLAAQVAHTRTQVNALRQVVDGEFRTLSDLIARVRTHPSWGEVDETKLRQTAVDRLHAMGNEIENTYMPGPRGSRLRLVRRRRPSYCKFDPLRTTGPFER